MSSRLASFILVLSLAGSCYWMFGYLRSRGKGWILSAFAGLFVGMFTMGFLNGVLQPLVRETKIAKVDQIANQQAAEARATAEAAPPTPVAIVAPNCLDVEHEYTANEIAADKTWKGGICDVEGVVISIDKDMMGNGRLMLKRERSSTPWLATLDRRMTDKAARIQKGQNVAVRCRVKGIVLGNLNLDGCVY